MKKHTISELKQMFQLGNVNDEILDELKKDDRKGVQQLIQKYERKIANEKIQEMNFYKMCEIEQIAYHRGNTYIAGVDEAGRGPLAGPVVAAAVILPRDFKLIGLNDSKQLSEKTREKYSEIIKTEAISYGIGIIDNRKIDELNIFEATKLAMYDAIKKIEREPDHVLIDAVRLENLSCTSESIIKGDAKSVSIAAASILAKVTRDHVMEEISKEYPAYDFKTNKGYGTAAHMKALNELGPTPYHRMSFAPVKSASLALGGVSTEYK